MANKDNLYPPLVRISDPGTKVKPNYTGFLFYQCYQFDPTERMKHGGTPYVGIEDRYLP
jgi:hypothetical protein